MRILYAIPRYGEQFTSNETHGEIVRELQQLGVAVDVLSFTTRSGASGPGGWSAGFGRERVYRHVQNRSLYERPLALLAHHTLHYEYFFSMLAGYLALVRNTTYDLVHVEGTFPLGAVAALATPLVRTPYIITTTGGDLFRLPEQGYGYGHYPLPRQLMRLALRHAAWVRTNSRLSGRLCVGYGADPQRMTPLPVSIADVCYPPLNISLQTYRTNCRTRLTTFHKWTEMLDQPTTPLLVFVGRLMSLKAPELLVEALPQIIARVGRVRLCIVGPSRTDPQHGDYLAFLQQRATTLQVAHLCTFPGGVPSAKVKEYLAAADLLLVPSRLEGLNRVVIEAGAVGTASVISDGAGAAELVAHYGNGLVVPMGNVDALAHAVCRLLTTPAALQECGTRALMLAHDHSAAAVAQGLVGIYRRVINEQITSQHTR
jgi:glycosyltransferase involved in cell wall biosynthesis